MYQIPIRATRPQTRLPAVGDLSISSRSGEESGQIRDVMDALTALVLNKEWVHAAAKVRVLVKL